LITRILRAFKNGNKLNMCVTFLSSSLSLNFMLMVSAVMMGIDLCTKLSSNSKEIKEYQQRD
jgi:hypothetical protein